jgi:hypothetical protein
MVFATNVWFLKNLPNYASVLQLTSAYEILSFRGVLKDISWG